MNGEVVVATVIGCIVAAIPVAFILWVVVLVVQAIKKGRGDR